MPTILRTHRPDPDPTPIPGTVRLSFGAKARSDVTAVASYTIDGGTFKNENGPTNATRSFALGPSDTTCDAVFTLGTSENGSPTIRMTLEALPEIPDSTAWALNRRAPAARSLDMAPPAEVRTPRPRTALLVAVAVIVLLLLLLVLWRAR